MREDSELGRMRAILQSVSVLNTVGSAERIHGVVLFAY